VGNDWAWINGEIRRIMAGPDPVSGLEALFARTGDGYVALTLADVLAHEGNPYGAVDWYARAEGLLPLPKFRRRASNGLARAQRACKQSADTASHPDDPVRGGTLYVVCCTKGKVWDHLPPAEQSRLFRARHAYTGRTFQTWNASGEAAAGVPWMIFSAKYGFIEPDREIANYDVTFSDPSTLPIATSALRAQVRELRDDLGRRPVDFDRVVVLGSGTYIAQARAAFAGGRAQLVDWRDRPPVPPSDPGSPNPGVITDPPAQARRLGEAMAMLPDAVFTQAEETLPEWPVLPAIATLPPGLAVLATLGIAVNNYRLAAGGADRYWDEAGRLFAPGGITTAEGVRERLAALGRTEVAALDDAARAQKAARLDRLFSSPLAGGAIGGGAATNPDGLWAQLAAALGASPDAKTVVYAMRTVALLYRAATGRTLALPPEIPIPVDIRIVWVTLAAGLIDASPDDAATAMRRAAGPMATERRDEIVAIWRSVAVAAGRPAIALDAVLWQLGGVLEDRRGDHADSVHGVVDHLMSLGAEASAAASVARALTEALGAPGAPRGIVPEPAPHVGGVDAEEFDLDEATRVVESIVGRVPTQDDPASGEAESDPSVRTDASLLHPAVRDALYEQVLPGKDLYSHQGRAIRGAIAGKDVVIETGTASGKTLCYQVPIFDALCRDPTATALYLAPINALVADQLGAVRRFASGIEPTPHEVEDFVIQMRIGDRRVTAARYDGAVPSDVRRTVRSAAPRLLITNPDMLSRGIVPHHGLWRAFLGNLRYVVLDEMHAYRGLFGANIANLLRRLGRVAARSGAEPAIIGCSASIGNPEELFEDLTGRKPDVVIRARESGAPRHPRRTMVVDTLKVGTEADEPGRTAADILSGLIELPGARSIAFMRTIREVDAVHRAAVDEVSRRVQRDRADHWVRQYKREIPWARKAEIVEDLKSGAARAVVATTALQMGIDIGALSIAVIGGFPGTHAAYLQGAGRAGRSGSGLVVVLLGISALDQHYALRPEELLLPTPEMVFVNPDNAEVVGRHVLAAAAELPLSAADASDVFGPDTVTIVKGLREAGDLIDMPNGHLTVAPRHKGCGSRLDIRTTVGFDCIVRDAGGRIVSQPDAARALRYYHPDALVMVDGRTYRVTEFDLDWEQNAGHGRVQEVPRTNERTRPEVRLHCGVITREESSGGSLPLASVNRGIVSTEVSVPAYRYFEGSVPGTRVVLGARALSPLVTETEGLWFDLPPGWLDGIAKVDQLPALTSAGEALRLAAALVCSTDPIDIGLHIDAGELPTRIYLSDIEEGGNGLTRTVFQHCDDLLRRARERLEGCPHCAPDSESRGCPKCVTALWGDPHSVYRLGGIGILGRLEQEVLELGARV